LLNYFLAAVSTLGAAVSILGAAVSILGAAVSTFGAAVSAFGVSVVAGVSDALLQAAKAATTAKAKNTFFIWCFLNFKNYNFIFIQVFKKGNPRVYNFFFVALGYKSHKNVLIFTR
jgi:hypothetical protein